MGLHGLFVQISSIKLFYTGIRSNKSVPFFPSANSIPLNRSTYNKSYLKNYGLLMKTVNKRFQFLDIPNTVVWTPDRMLYEMIKMGKFQQPSKKYHILYSQNYLYK